MKIDIERWEEVITVASESVEDLRIIANRLLEHVDTLQTENENLTHELIRSHKSSDVATNPRSRKGDPDTSHEAAAAATLKMTPDRLLVINMLHMHGNLTDTELNKAAKRTGSTLRARRKDLVNAGYVMPYIVNGKVARRKTERGQPSKVWTLTPDGRLLALGYKGPDGI